MFVCGIEDTGYPISIINGDQFTHTRARTHTHTRTHTNTHTHTHIYTHTHTPHVQRTKQRTASVTSFIPEGTHRKRIGQ